MEGTTTERKRKSSHKLTPENKKEKCVSNAKKTKRLSKQASEEEKNVKLLLPQLNILDY